MYFLELSQVVGFMKFLWAHLCERCQVWNHWDWLHFWCWRSSYYYMLADASSYISDRWGSVARRRWAIVGTPSSLRINVFIVLWGKSCQRGISVLPFGLRLGYPCFRWGTYNVSDQLMGSRSLLDRRQCWYWPSPLLKPRSRSSLVWGGFFSRRYLGVEACSSSQVTRTPANWASLPWDARAIK